MDLVKGYYQILVRAEDIQKTIVITPFGLFKLTQMPFGLKSAAQTFQRLMHTVLQGLDNFLFVYLDDVLVASRSRNEHISHLKTLFARLETNGLVIKSEKCVFGVAEIDFLGHRVTKQGITPLPSKVETIRTYPEPPSAKEPTKAQERFLGMFNYYHKFVPNAAELLQPLYQALQASPPANKKAPKVGRPKKTLT